MPSIHDPPSGMIACPSGTDLARPCGPGDPLADVLRTVRLRGALFFMVEATAPWSVGVPRADDFSGIILPGARHLVSYHVVVDGAGVACMPGGEHVEFAPGDVIVFPHGDRYGMSSTPGLPPELSPDETLQFFREMAAGRLPFTVREGGGGAPCATLLCGFLGCDLSPFNPLLRSLPRLLRISRPRPGTDLLDRLIDLAMAEIRSARPGGESIRLGLCELMFVEVIRRHIAAQPAGGSGWLAGLRDPVVGRALAELHARPARDWTLEALSREIGASRTVLAGRFAARVGETPMRYLTLWRMQLAARRLEDGAPKVSAVAEEVGFRSEAAFSRSFKKLTGLSPAAWRDSRSALPASTRADPSSKTSPRVAAARGRIVT